MTNWTKLVFGFVLGLALALGLGRADAEVSRGEADRLARETVAAQKAQAEALKEIAGELRTIRMSIKR